MTARALLHGARQRSRAAGDPRSNARLPPGRTRILALGDSITFGYYLEEDETCPARLEADLAGESPIYEGQRAAAADARGRLTVAVYGTALYELCVPLTRVYVPYAAGVVSEEPAPEEARLRALAEARGIAIVSPADAFEGRPLESLDHLPLERPHRRRGRAARGRRGRRAAAFRAAPPHRDSPLADSC